MKILLAALLLSILGSAAAFAAPPAFGVTLSGALTTQITSGTVAAFSTVPVNNKTIISSVFASGTTGAAKASQLALAFQDGDLVVIVPSQANKLVASVATPGSASNKIGIVSNKGGKAVFRSTVDDFEFTLPGVATVQRTCYQYTENISKAGLSFTFMFFGGQGYLNAGATQFQGAFKFTGKIY